MIAYKFRGSNQIEFVLDILLNRRLHCADWRKLNDPMEGLYAYSTNGRENSAQRTVKGIGDAKSQYRVCSLSSSFQSHLLWSHYANGFDGVAIEVDLPDGDRRIQRVKYRGVFEFLNMDDVVSVDEAARKILFSKYLEWKYEKEIRILQNQEFYELTEPPLRVIAGHRMNQALFRTLHMVCDHEGIELCKLGIGDEGLDADAVNPKDLGNRRRRFRHR